MQPAAAASSKRAGQSGMCSAHGGVCGRAQQARDTLMLGSHCFGCLLPYPPSAPASGPSGPAVDSQGKPSHNPAVWPQDSCEGCSLSQLRAQSVLCSCAWCMTAHRDVPRTLTVSDRCPIVSANVAVVATLATMSAVRPALIQSVDPEPVGLCWSASCALERTSLERTSRGMLRADAFRLQDCIVVLSV